MFIHKISFDFATGTKNHDFWEYLKIEGIREKKIAYFSKEIQQFSFAYLEKKETYKATFFNFSTEFPDQEKIHCFIFSSISNVGKKLHPAIEEYKDFQIWLNKKDSNEFLNKSCF